MVYINADLRETHTIGTATREYIVSPQAVQALAAYHIQLAGISYALPPFRFVRPRPPMAQILACQEGQGMVLVDGQWLPCSPGMAYLTPPGVLHAYYALDVLPWKVCWIMYDPQKQERPVFTTDRPLLVQSTSVEFATSLDGLYHEAMGSAEEALLHQWTYLVHTYAQRIAGQTHFDGRLQRLWKLVDANLAYPWNNQALAAHASMSCEHLRRLCQQQFGHSPMKHVTILRMQRAMALLLTDTYSIVAIAQAVGYENPFAFSTAFKRHVGIAPSLYRLSPDHQPLPSMQHG